MPSGGVGGDLGLVCWWLVRWGGWQSRPGLATSGEFISEDDHHFYPHFTWQLPAGLECLEGRDALVGESSATVVDESCPFRGSMQLTLPPFEGWGFEGELPPKK